MSASSQPPTLAVSGPVEAAADGVDGLFVAAASAVPFPHPGAAGLVVSGMTPSEALSAAVAAGDAVAAREAMRWFADEQQAVLGAVVSRLDGERPLAGDVAAVLELLELARERWIEQAAALVSVPDFPPGG